VYSVANHYIRFLFAIKACPVPLESLHPGMLNGVNKAAAVPSLAGESTRTRHTGVEQKFTIT
jgi:hypothetical protein